jgi:methylmalonyl-CoA/ethylmalonyl-CoA epimerase
VERGAEELSGSVTEDSPPAVSLAQVAMVVADAQAKMESFQAALGWGPWLVYELTAPVLHDLEAGGAATDGGAMIAAIATVGAIQFELLQPLGPGPLQDHLDRAGEGLHHILCHPPEGGDAEFNATLAALSGRPPILAGGIGGGDLRFDYYDLEAELGLVVETLRGVVDDSVAPTRVFPPASD